MGRTRELETSEIVKRLIEEKCLCLCSNCHSLFHSRYYEFANEILIEYLDKDDLEVKLQLLKLKHNKISDNILKFKFPDFSVTEFNISSIYRDNWKKHLQNIYQYTKNHKLKYFKAYDLEDELGISMRHVYKHLNKFIEKGIIQEDINVKSNYFFTNFGLEYVKKISNPQDFWDILFLEIFYFFNSLNEEYFSALDMQNSLNLIMPRRILNNFMQKNYISKKINSEILYYFTQIGIERVNWLELELKIISRGLQNPTLLTKGPNSERWKLYIIKIFNYIRIKQSTYFTPKDLTFVLNMASTNVHKNIKKFMERKLITKIDSGKYQFSDFGLKIVGNLEKEINFST